MRLDILTGGQRLIDRARFSWRELRSGKKVTDIHKAMFYRSEFFGKPFQSYWGHAQYRGRSKLSVGERQVLAAIVSQSNRCQFCTVGHAEAATRYLPQQAVHGMLEDADSLVLGDEVAALARFARRLATNPGEVSADDVTQLRGMGIADDDIETTVHLCAAYSIINRIADALDFEVPDIYGIEVEDDTREIRVRRSPSR